MSIHWQTVCVTKLSLLQTIERKYQKKKNTIDILHSLFQRPLKEIYRFKMVNVKMAVAINSQSVSRYNIFTQNIFIFHAWKKKHLKNERKIPHHSYNRIVDNYRRTHCVYVQLKFNFFFHIIFYYFELNDFASRWVGTNKLLQQTTSLCKYLNWIHLNSGEISFH